MVGNGLLGDRGKPPVVAVAGSTRQPQDLAQEESWGEETFMFLPAMPATVLRAEND